MCSAILSDTLAFRSPTCTLMDRNAAEHLAELAGIDIDKYANEMFEAGASLEGKSAKDIFYTDFKPFACGEVHFGIGQSSFMSDRSAQKAKDLLLPYLDEVREREGLDLVCYMLTNILTESTELIYAGFHAGRHRGPQLPRCCARGKQRVFAWRGVPQKTNGAEFDQGHQRMAVRWLNHLFVRAAKGEAPPFAARLLCCGPQ